MKKIQLTLLALFMATQLWAQDDTDSRKLDNFSGLRVSEGIELVVKKGNEFSIEIETWDMDADQVVTEIRRDKLVVHLKRDFYRRRKRIKAVLTYKGDLNDVTASTASTVRIEDKITTRDLELTASTSGQIEVEVAVELLDLAATTSGRIDVSGSADEVTASASTGGTIYAYDVDAKEGRARANTGADVRVSVEDYLSARAGTGGSVKYRGQPRTSVSTNTGGSVRRSN